MNELKIFENEEFGQVRTVVVNGEPYFVGKDVSDVLGYQNGSRDINRHVDEEDRRTENIMQYQNGTLVSKTILINESGLYSLILGSKLPTAKKFKHWVTSEVLPSIRKTGSYNLPQTFSEALRALADSEEEKEKLLIENNEMKPKADFFDAVADSKSAISIGDVAKTIGARGIGRNKLFQILRDEKVLMQNNVPYQKFIDKGFFRVIETHYSGRDGMPVVAIKTLVYQRGVDYIRKMLKAA